MKANVIARKNREIEVLRGVAILMVLWCHLMFLFPWSSDTIARLLRIAPGWGGVDLFFCISGYVITRSIGKDLDGGGSFVRSAVSFWIRRAWRLWPSAWLWLGFTIVMSVVSNASGAFHSLLQNAGDALAVLFQLANFHVYECTRDGGLPCGGNGMYWSLSLEEQFYLVFPFLVFFVPKRARIVALAAIVLVQFFWVRPVWTIGWAIRTDAICLGVLLAMLTDDGDRAAAEPTFLRSRPLALLFFAVSIVLIAVLPSKTLFVAPFSTGLIALVSAALVFAASYNRNYVLPVPILSEIMAWIGARSYALYLIHIPMFNLAHEIWHRASGGQLSPRYSLRVALTVYPLLFLLAELNYRFVEEPGKKYGRKMADAVRERKERAPSVAA